MPSHDVYLAAGAVNEGERHCTLNRGIAATSCTKQRLAQPEHQVLVPFSRASKEHSSYYVTYITVDSEMRTQSPRQANRIGQAQ
jgi:hypothetical protein